MKRFFFSICFLCTWLLSIAQNQRFQFMEPKMGSPFHVIFYAPDSAIANELARRSFQLVDSFNIIYSDYLDTSELNRLSATAGKDSFVHVSPALFQIMQISQKAWELSNGSFDVTMGALSRLWRRARREKRFPGASEIEQARSSTGFDKIILDPASSSIKLTGPGIQLDLGGIAQGYVAQKVLDFLHVQGIRSALINASGDIVCSEAPPGKNGWIVGVNLPQDAVKLLDKKIELRNKAVSTSGDVYQFFEYNGKRYSHIIDPRTGYGLTFQRNVTVIAPDGTSADWLATACSILPINKAKKLVKKMNAELLITQMKKGKLKIYTTKGMKQHWNLH